MGVKQPEAHLDHQKVKGMAAKSNDLMGHLRVCRFNHTMEICSSAPANPIQLDIMDRLFYEVGAAGEGGESLRIVSRSKLPKVWEKLVRQFSTF